MQDNKFETNIPTKETARPLPNFHIHVSLSDLYIPTNGYPTYGIFCSKVGGPIVELQYITRSQKHECGNWERGRAVSFLVIFVSNFRYSVFAVRDGMGLYSPLTRLLILSSPFLMLPIRERSCSENTNSLKILIKRPLMQSSE